MRILIAEDDRLFRRLLQGLLASEGDISMAEDGTTAWQLLQQTHGPVMAVLDWVMPGMTGPEICRAARANAATAGAYLILLTGRNSSADILAGLRAGADDYVTKPFEAEDLHARVRLGRRIMELQQAIEARDVSLNDAFSREKSLLDRLSQLEHNVEPRVIVKRAAAGASRRIT